MWFLAQRSHYKLDTVPAGSFWKGVWIFKHKHHDFPGHLFHLINLQVLIIWRRGQKVFYQQQEENAD